MAEAVSTVHRRIVVADITLEMCDAGKHSLLPKRFKCVFPAFVESALYNPYVRLLVSGMNAFPCSSRTDHLEQARQRLLDREHSEMRRNARLQEQAASDAGTIIDMMVRIYRPRRVFQWGSLLRPGAFKPYSDIDIAIEGITDAERFFAMLGQAQALTRFPLDIVQMEKIAPEHAEDIRRYGKLVHERE